MAHLSDAADVWQGLLDDNRTGPLYCATATHTEESRARDGEVKNNKKINNKGLGVKKYNYLLIQQQCMQQLRRWKHRADSIWDGTAPHATHRSRRPIHLEKPGD